MTLSRPTTRDCLRVVGERVQKSHFSIVVVSKSSSSDLVDLILLGLVGQRDLNSRHVLITFTQDFRYPEGLSNLRRRTSGLCLTVHPVCVDIDSSCVGRRHIRLPTLQVGYQPVFTNNRHLPLAGCD